MRDRLTLPAAGQSKDSIISSLEKIKLDPVRGHWSMVFRATPDVQELSRQVYTEFFSDNGIFSYRVPYMQNIEQQVIEMCLSILNAALGAAGNMTSGGSESIYSALHAIREWAKENKPHVKQPTIIAPYSAHPSFSKGCHYFGLRLKRIPLGTDFRADPAAMAEAIDEDTVAMVGSAPCWPYALYDPIEKIASIAKENGLWMHVDACVGGYLAPFVSKLGYDLPRWDFTVPGVMSISADLHKYGYCPKPCSTILWRDASLQKHHFVHPSDWPGGEYSTTGFAGTRIGGAIFAAWAVMNYLGHDGYLRMAKRVMDAREEMTKQINEIDELEVWSTHLLPLPVRGVGVDIGKVSAALSARGYIILGTQEPPLINIPIDPAVDELVMSTFINDLKDVVRGVVSGEIDSKSSLVYG
ncbi:MAG: pyridoxal-dependent decarboxylase [Parvularculaceae bacterium]